VRKNAQVRKIINHKYFTESTARLEQFHTQQYEGILLSLRRYSAKTHMSCKMATATIIDRITSLSPRVHNLKSTS